MQELRDELTALRQNKVEMEAEVQRLAGQLATGQPANPVSVIHSQVHMQALLHDLPMWQAGSSEATAAAAAAAAVAAAAGTAGAGAPGPAPAAAATPPAPAAPAAPPVSDSPPAAAAAAVAVASEPY